jgi:leucyl aminopeptidase
MPGPAANKPGDILTAMDGTTIEVNNTDAEGRLILSDALCYAVTKKPACIVDAATLTGAMVVALGSSHTGVYTNNAKMFPKVSKAAERAGESVWHMPLTSDHSNDIKGTYADLSNIGVAREAGSATAAAFLKHFVGDTPWAHFDIAGTAWHNGKRKAYHPKKGASGVMVRTFVELAKSY